MLVETFLDPENVFPVLVNILLVKLGCLFPVTSLLAGQEGFSRYSHSLYTAAIKKAHLHSVELVNGHGFL